MIQQVVGSYNTSGFLRLILFHTIKTNIDYTYIYIYIYTVPTSQRTSTVARSHKHDKTTIFLFNTIFTYLLNMEQSPYWETNQFSVNQEIPRALWNPVHYRIHKCPPPLPILSQIDPVHPSTFHFLKIQLNIIFPSSPGFSKWYLSLRFPHQNPEYTSPLPYMCYMPHPSHSSRYDHPNIIGWGIQIIVQKTKSMAVKGRDPVRTKIVIDNKIIEQVNLFNYLGNVKNNWTLTTNYITIWKLQVF